MLIYLLWLLSHLQQLLLLLLMLLLWLFVVVVALDILLCHDLTMLTIPCRVFLNRLVECLNWCCQLPMLKKKLLVLKNNDHYIEGCW